MNAKIHDGVGGFYIELITEDPKEICQLAKLSLNTLAKQSIKIHVSFMTDGMVISGFSLRKKKDLTLTIG